MTEKKNPFTTRTYDQEYFSSTQMNIYIGDVLVDEITSLSFTVQEKKRPHYGYNSRLFDAVSKGTVIVEGQFSINFKESYYLFNVLDRYAAQIGEAGRLLPWVATQGYRAAQGGEVSRGGATRYHLDGTAHRGTLTRNNIETQLWVDGLLKNGGPEREISKEQEQEYYQHLSGFTTPSGALGVAENMYERFEDAIWGEQSPDKESRLITNEKYNNFNVLVTYGDFNRNDRVNHTVKELQGVYITGCHQSEQIDGFPVQEYYTFFARNLA